MATKQEAGYRQGEEKERCELCEHFTPPHNCSVVEGLVQPQGVCNFFEQKGSKTEAELAIEQMLFGGGPGGGMPPGGMPPGGGMMPPVGGGY